MSTNLRDAAESTLHTVAEFVDDTLHTLQKVELPSLALPSLSLPSLPSRHKSGPSLLAKAVGVLAAGALLVAVLAALKNRRSGGDAPSTQSSDKDVSGKAATNGLTQAGSATKPDHDGHADQDVERAAN